MPVPQTKHQGEIDGKEPHVTGKAIQTTPLHRLLPGEPGKLTVCRIAEICQHQQENAQHVMQRIGEEEHDTRPYSEEDRQNGYGIGSHPQAIPQQGKRQSDGTCEMNIQPFLGVHGLEGSMEKRTEPRAADGSVALILY